MSSRFYGRTKDLEWLRGRFDHVSSWGPDRKFTGPQMAVLVAESGLGKSRLVRELYLQLANDPEWNPKETAYWPGSFGGDDRQMRESPSLEGHVPLGPPKFMWLGVRWQPIDRRNADTHSRLDVLNTDISNQMRLVDKYGPAWKSLLERRKKELIGKGIDNITGIAADLLMPFGGVCLNLLREAERSMRERHFGPIDNDGVAKAQAENTRAAMLEYMHGLLSGSRAIPTILFLDDAQFSIEDQYTLSFVAALWKQAVQNNWPLLIICAYWQQDWNVLKQQTREDTTLSLAGMVDGDRLSERALSAACAADLEAILAERFPGLSPKNRQSLLSKAGNNFASMVENMNDLSEEPYWFVDRRFDRPLSKDGSDGVDEWSALRHERKLERFQKLTESRRNVLGWSSRLGVRFMTTVVAKFAAEIARHEEDCVDLDVPREIDWCVDPGVFLSESGGQFCEFRDKIYHEFSIARYDKTLRNRHEECLVRIFREVLVGAVNANYAFIFSGAPSREAHLCDEDVGPLFSSSLLELEPGFVDDWRVATPEARAWLRTICLMIVTGARDRQWDRVGECERQLGVIEWHRVPLDLVDQNVRGLIADALRSSRALGDEVVLRRDAVRRADAALTVCRDEDSEYRYSCAQVDLGQCLYSLGKFGEAALCLESANEVAGKYKHEPPYPERWADVSIDCCRALARCAYLCGNMAAAASWGGGIIVLAGYASRADKSPAAAVRRQARIADALSEACWYELACGQYEEAAEYIKKAERLMAAIVDQGHSADYRRLHAAIVMRRGMVQLGRADIAVVDIPRMVELPTAGCEQAAADIKLARDSFSRGLSICKLVVDESTDPDVHYEHKSYLDWCGFAAHMDGEASESEALYRQSFDVATGLHEKIGTLRSLRETIRSRLLLASQSLSCKRHIEAQSHLLEARKLACDLPVDAVGVVDIYNGISLLVLGMKVAKELGNSNEYMPEVKSVIGEVVHRLSCGIDFKDTGPGSAFRNLMEATGAVVRVASEREMVTGLVGEIPDMWKTVVDAGRKLIGRGFYPNFRHDRPCIRPSITPVEYNLYCARVACDVGAYELAKELLEENLLRAHGFADERVRWQRETPKKAFEELMFEHWLWDADRKALDNYFECAKLLAKCIDGGGDDTAAMARKMPMSRDGDLCPEQLSSLVSRLIEPCPGGGGDPNPSFVPAVVKYAFMLEGLCRRELAESGFAVDCADEAPIDVSRFMAIEKDKYWGHKVKVAIERCLGAYECALGVISECVDAALHDLLTARAKSCRGLLDLLEGHVER